MTATGAPAAPAGRERLPTLDLLRFVAAAMVLLYHYTFRAAVDGKYTSVSFSELDHVSRYGFLGVDLFFIISGFVILLTVDAGQGNPAHFVASRISRLFPAFWAAATLTFLITLHRGPQFSVGPTDYLLNLGMIPSYLGVPYVDGVYWTLETELSFYVLVFVYLMLFWRYIRIEWLLVSWLAISVPLSAYELGPGIARSLLIVDAAPFFVGGCLFYIIWRQGWTWFRAAILIAAWAAAAAVAGRDTGGIGDLYGVGMSKVVTDGIVTAGFTIFLVLILRPSWFRFGGRRATLLGALTYPLYLIHQKCGYLVINAVDPVAGRWVALAVAIAIALTIAYLIHRLVERRYNSRLRRWLEPRLGLLTRISAVTRSHVRNLVPRQRAATDPPD